MRAGNGDIHTPFIVAVVSGAERGNRIDQQQRGVACLIDGPTDSGNVRLCTGGGFIMHHADSLDAMGLVGLQPFGNAVASTP